MKNKHPVLRRFMRRKVSVVAAAVLILFVLIAILGPLVWQVDPLKQSVMKKYGPMTVQHPLGTDNLGRDTLARMIYGARVSLAISFAGVLSGALIGVLLGVSAGYFGGWVDAIISRFIDILLAFPGLLLAITIVAVLGPGSVNTVIAITIFTIPGLTRMVRSVVLSLKSSEYVEACKTMGESNLRIIFTHVIPNSMSQIIAALHTQLGLDDPLVVQYFRWVGNCLRLDFGTSTAVVGKPVSEMIASHFQPTILLAIYSQLITILIAIPCGMLAAKKRGTIADYFVSVLSMLGISLPSFLMGLGMVLLFAVNLRVLPAAGYKNPFTDGFLPFLRYMTLPAVSLGFIHAGYMMRMTKASMLEVLGSDYIKMARSKGVREWKIVTKHTFRNALLTVITVVGQGFISALAGAAVVERLFNIPGMGSLMVDSIEKRDYQVIQAITLLIAMLNVFINLIIDLIYGLADPRIRLD